MILGIDCSRYAAEQPTGVEHYTDRIVEGLVLRADELGYDQLRLYVRTAVQVERLLALIQSTGQQQVEVVLIERRRFWTLLGLSWQMLRNPVDVLFIPSHVLPWFSPRRSLLTVHGLESFHFPQAYSWFQRWQQRASLRYAKRKGSHFVAVSSAVREDLRRFLGIHPDRVRVVWNGFDAPDTAEVSEVSFVEGEFLLSVGRLEDRKNQCRLVQAFDILAENYPELQLVLVGPDGQGAAAVREQVQASPFRQRIVLAGYQEQSVVQSLMARARVFCYPSLAEGFGIPILEAFAAGTPVMTSQGSACEEIAGEAAVLVDPLVVGEMVRALQQLLDDENLREGLVKQGKERLSSFSWKRCTEETAELLRNLSR